MSVNERDPHSGHKMTGHEWDGIKELNTPVPKAVWFFLIVTVIFSIIYWVLMPAWPTGDDYTKGVLGVDQQRSVERSIEKAKRERADWEDRLLALPPDAVKSDTDLMQIVKGTGHSLFGDNCAVCHGMDARGGPGFPNLRDGAWLWGGDYEAIAETIRVGINASHDETRFGQMPAFGRDQMLARSDILAAISYVQSLSSGAGDMDPALVAQGADIFSANCAACHGEDGRGMTMMGAPDLTDDIWLYGGDRQTLFETLWNGRQGQMPSWEGRLTALDRKILALYVLELRDKTAD